MQYNQDGACVYDTIFYLLTQFNWEYYSAKFSLYDSGAEINSENFRYVKKNSQPTPAMLSVFFKKFEQEAVISIFHKKYLDVTAGCEDFLDAINKNADYLYDTVVQQALGANLSKDASKEDLIEAIENAKRSDGDKLHLALVLSNFDHALSLLCKTLANIHNAVKDLHARKSADIEHFGQMFLSQKNLKLLEREHHFDRETCENGILAVSLINPYVEMCSYCGDTVFFMFGLKSRYSPAAQNAVTGSVAMHFISACGSEVRMKMLMGLAERKAMSLTDFSKYVGASIPTVNHNLRLLLDGEIIKTSHREKKSIYYEINRELLLQFKNDITALLNKLLD